MTFDQIPIGAKYVITSTKNNLWLKIRPFKADNKCEYQSVSIDNLKTPRLSGYIFFIEPNKQLDFSIIKR